MCTKDSYANYGLMVTVTVTCKSGMLQSITVVGVVCDVDYVNYGCPTSNVYADEGRVYRLGCKTDVGWWGGIQKEVYVHKLAMWVKKISGGGLPI